jgi:hypothetical protein
LFAQLLLFVCFFVWPALKTRATFMSLNYNKISLFLVNEVLLNRIFALYICP